MQQNENFAKQAEQAEAERPEIVATLFTPNEKVHNVIGFKAFAVAGDCDKDGGEFYDPEKLMTVAQHERIVRALRAVITQLRQHKNDYMDAGQETYRALQNEIRDREAEIARLDGLVSGRTAERDAALARVAELELKLDKSDYAYDNDRIHMRGLAARAIARAKVFDDGSDGADAESARSVVAILRELLAVGPAQAQHSVPDDDMILQIFADNAEHSEQGDEHGYCIVREQHAQAIARKLLAAAPGKEGV
ncbi:hypothetical protein ACQQ4Q_005935 [Pseudomonas aeruginosa]